jgi:hypothetical protein
MLAVSSFEGRTSPMAVVGWTALSETGRIGARRYYRTLRRLGQTPQAARTTTGCVVFGVLMGRLSWGRPW